MFPSEFGVRESEGGARDGIGEEWSLSLPLSLLWQESASGNLQASYYGDASGGGRRELGGVVSCGAGVEARF